MEREEITRPDLPALYNIYNGYLSDILREFNNIARDAGFNFRYMIDR